VLELLPSREGAARELPEPQDRAEEED
jgi:hypothetical protein